MPEVPFLESVADYVAYYAARKPDQEALVDEERRITFAELHDEVERWAAALHAAGVRKGDVVATLSMPSATFFMSFLAVTRVGGIWFGLNPRSRPAELAYLLDDARPKIVFSIEAFEGRCYAKELDELSRDRRFDSEVVRLAEVPKDGIGCREFLSRGCTSPLPSFRAHPDDPAVIVYTSGTTGEPKGAVLSHRGLIGCFRAQLDYIQAEPLRIINNLPINHIGSVGDVSLFALLAGGTTVFMKRFDAGAVIETIERERITVWGQVPTQFQLALDSAEAESADLRSLVAVFWSGGAASRELVRRLRTICHRLCNAYGLTESVSNFCYTEPDAGDEVLANTVGRPDARYQVRIVRPDGRIANPGEEGEIHVRSQFLMLGYLNRPDATAEAIDDEGWLHTGDVGVVRDDGNICLVGRMKEMFKSGGYNIYPREIEQVLESHKGVSTAVVVETPHALYGEVGVAFVQPGGNGGLGSTDLRSFCEERLANYKIPKKFVLCSGFPMLAIGKVDKAALREAAGAELTGTAEERQ